VGPIDKPIASACLSGRVWISLPPIRSFPETGRTCFPDLGGLSLSTNVHIVNGTGQMGIVNGTGNLIIGYDEPISAYKANSYDQMLPIATITARMGSHNLIIGSYHAWAGAFGNLIAGEANAATGEEGVVAGKNNRISDASNAVLLGSNNWASGGATVVVGGFSNWSTNGYTVELGGGYNRENAAYSTCLGGWLHNDDPQSQPYAIVPLQVGIGKYTPPANSPYN
jgi:hypothetical protein